MPRFYADIRVYFELDVPNHGDASDLAHTFASAVMIECPGTEAKLWDLKQLGESVPPCPHGFGDDVVCVQCHPKLCPSCGLAQTHAPISQECGDFHLPVGV